MKQNDKAAGFSLVEVMIALVILLVGILSTISALSFGIVSLQDSEKRSISKEAARSTMETVFSMRDLLAFDPTSGGSVYSWDALQVKNGSNSGIFVDGWKPIRESPGADGIYGTEDDVCDAAISCVVGTTVNNSPVIPGYLRKIEITDITENGVVRKRVMTVRIKYYVGQMAREETESTILANYPISE